MERFFRSLKAERLNHQSFANHYEVVQNVESYIYFYNYKRIHSAIGYITPAFILPCGVQKMAELEKVAWNVSKINGPLHKSIEKNKPAILIFDLFPFIKFTNKHLSKWVAVFSVFERSEFRKYNEWDLVWIGSFIGDVIFWILF